MPGIILEGGTFRPIFSAGVMDALLDEDIMFPYMIGVSAGICDGFSYISKQKERNLKTIDGVRKVRYSEGAAEGMMKINTMGTYLAGGIILILMAVSIFLVSNTVSIGVAVREEEISIMKLIGAANGFIKAPFQAEGMIIGILGSLIPTAIIFAGYEGIINWMNDKFHVVTVFMKFVPIQQIMLYLLPLALLVGIVIGLLGSSITIRKYLKV